MKLKNEVGSATREQISFLFRKQRRKNVAAGCDFAATGVPAENAYSWSQAEANGILNWVIFLLFPIMGAMTMAKKYFLLCGARERMFAKHGWSMV